MLKHMKNSSYLYEGKYYTLKALLQKVERQQQTQDKCCSFTRSIEVGTLVTDKNPKAQKVKLVFVRNQKQQ